MPHIGCGIHALLYRDFPPALVDIRLVMWRVVKCDLPLVYVACSEM